MPAYVALLRGINVGGNSLIKMSELRECMERQGYNSVTTYINSGNVFFKSDESDARKLEQEIERAIGAKFGFMPKTVVRSFAEIKTTLANLPKSWATNIDQKFNVIFLRHSIDSANILDELKPKAGIETLAYGPGVLYWSANTSDLTKSAMVKLAKSPLYQDMTVRNLNTAKKIYELMLAKFVQQLQTTKINKQG